MESHNQRVIRWTSWLWKSCPDSTQCFENQSLCDLRFAQYKSYVWMREHVSHTFIPLFFLSFTLCWRKRCGSRSERKSVLRDHLLYFLYTCFEIVQLTRRVRVLRNPRRDGTRGWKMGSRRWCTSWCSFPQASFPLEGGVPETAPFPSPAPVAAYLLSLSSSCSVHSRQ